MSSRNSSLFSSRSCSGRRFGAVTAGEDGDLAALILEFAGEFFHHRRLAGAADREVADGDDLHAEGGVAQDADVVKESSRAHCDLEELGRAIQEGTHHGGAFSAPALGNHVQHESLDRLSPAAQEVSHRDGVCQPPGGTAREVGSISGFGLPVPALRAMLPTEP